MYPFIWLWTCAHKHIGLPSKVRSLKTGMWQWSPTLRRRARRNFMNIWTVANLHVPYKGITRYTFSIFVTKHSLPSPPLMSSCLHKSRHAISQNSLSIFVLGVTGLALWTRTLHQSMWNEVLATWRTRNSFNTSRSTGVFLPLCVFVSVHTKRACVWISMSRRGFTWPRIWAFASNCTRFK